MEGEALTPAEVKSAEADESKTAEATEPTAEEAATNKAADPEDGEVEQEAAKMDKAVVADTVKAAVAEAVSGAITPLLARLEQVEKAAAPGGPVRTRTNADTTLATRRDELTSKAAGFRKLAREIDDPSIRAVYESRAKAAEDDLSKLA